MVRALVSSAPATVLAFALATAGCGTPPEPASGAEKTGAPASSAAAPGDKASDCRALVDAAKSFPTPEGDRPSVAEIKRGYETVANAFRSAKIKDRALVDLAKQATAMFQELAARAPTLEKDFSALESSIASAREQNEIAENIGNEVTAFCETLKPKANECSPLTKAIEGRPALSRKDLVEMDDFIRRMKAFQSEIKAVNAKNTQLAANVRRLDEAYTELNVRLTRMAEAGATLNKDSMTVESDALSEKMAQACRNSPGR